MLYFNAFKYYFKLTNAWIVQPQTDEKKLHASVISLNLAEKTKQKKTTKKTNKKMIIILVNIFFNVFFYITFLKCKNLKECNGKAMNRNWSNQKSNPALKTKSRNQSMLMPSKQSWV